MRWQSVGRAQDIEPHREAVFGVLCVALLGFALGLALPVAAQQPVPTPPAAPDASVAAAATEASSSAPVKNKLPTAADYNEVHIAPLVTPSVKSEERARFDPHSPAAAEAVAEAEAADAGTAPHLTAHTKPIRVDVDLVLVPVTVTDSMSRLVTGLEKDNFTLLDSGEKQSITTFSSEDAPISLGIVFDMSGSMSNKIEKAREAVKEFLRLANPEDEFFLIAFSDKPRLASDFTEHTEEIEEQLVYSVPHGRPALLDAVYLGISKMKQARHQRKALLILSDGGDNRSRYTENEIKSVVKEADVQMYGIGIFDFMPRSDEERFGPQLLAEITEVTGGRTINVDHPNELTDAATKIGLELRNQYVLGFHPTHPSRDGRWRKVRVRLNAPKGLPVLSVYAKTGYYAPTQ